MASSAAGNFYDDDNAVLDEDFLNDDGRQTSAIEVLR
jgi:hypothetical protein